MGTRLANPHGSEFVANPHASRGYPRANGNPRASTLISMHAAVYPDSGETAWSRHTGSDRCQW